MRLSSKIEKLGCLYRDVNSVSFSIFQHLMRNIYSVARKLKSITSKAFIYHIWLNVSTVYTKLNAESFRRYALEKLRNLCLIVIASNLHEIRIDRRSFHRYR